MESESPTQRDPGRLAGWLFGALACLYVFAGSGHIASPDGVVMFRVAERLATAARADIQPLENWPGFGGFAVRGPDGAERFYAKYGLGQSLAAVPTTLVGQLLAPLALAQERGVFDTPIGVTGPPDAQHPFGQGNPFRLRWDDWRAEAWPRPFVSWTASWTNAWVSAAVVAVLFLLGCELGFGLRASLAMAGVAGLATPMLPYAKTFFSEPLAALALVSFVLLAVRAARRERGVWQLFGAGLALGACVAVKVAHAVLVIPGVLFVAALVWRRQRFFEAAGQARARVAAAVHFGLGLAIPLLLVAAYNFLRFGSAFETGYGSEVDQWTTPVLEGLSGLLASPGRGLLWYAPAVVASLAFAPRFARRFPVEAGFVLGCFALLLATYASWYMWEGGWCWGPRFLVPVLPVLLLPLGAGIAQAPQGLALRASLGAAVLVGAVVAGLGASVDAMDFHNWLKLHHAFHAESFAAAGVSGYYDLVRWDWSFSPLLAYPGFPVKDAFLLPHALARPGLVLALLLGFGAGSLLCVWRLAGALRAAESREAVSGSGVSVAP